jgi:hypothetical protein
VLWIALSLFFCWMIFREFQSRWKTRAGYDGPDPSPISKPYVALMLALALAFAWPPFNTWRIERLLSAQATQLAEFHRARVHCNTVFDTLFDRESMSAGHASPQTGQIGVPETIARQNAIDYYRYIYLSRGTTGGFQAPYFSEQCAPGKALDEHLADSTWAAP